jgi:hypothetical protein
MVLERHSDRSIISNQTELLFSLHQVTKLRRLSSVLIQSERELRSSFLNTLLQLVLVQRLHLLIIIQLSSVYKRDQDLKNMFTIS